MRSNRHEAEVVRLEVESVGTKNDGPLDDVLQLADVARPGMGLAGNETDGN